VALALVSVIVLSVTGYAWAKTQAANSGLTKEDVISGASADGSLNILLVGMDSRTDAKGNPLPAAQLDALHAGDDDGEIDTDTMILIHIPAGGGQAVGLSIPRDSWVNIPGYGDGKINSAFGLAKNAALKSYRAAGRTDTAKMDVDSNAAGAKLTIQTIQNLTGVTIDHYASINLEGFYQISNAIGGVQVCLLHPVDDSKWSGAVFPAGQFTVQGVQALEFVRQRHNIPGGSTDLEREQRQQAFLASMAHKILSGGVLTHPSEMDSLISAVQSAVTIDSKWDLLGFAQQMTGMSSGKIKFQTIPVENIDYAPTSGVSAVEVDPTQVQAFIKDSEGGGTSPSDAANASTSASAPAQGSTSGNSSITVNVRNATGEQGLASAVLDVLTKQGFAKGDTGNSANGPSSKSVIYYHSGQESDAQAVSSALGGNFTLEEDSGVSSGQVSVYIGKNYNGPTTPSAAGSGSAAGSTGAAAPPTTTAPAGGTAPLSDAGTVPCIN
jgi:LCP family protein required for cell wall assembly